MNSLRFDAHFGMLTALKHGCMMVDLLPSDGCQVSCHLKREQQTIMSTKLCNFRAELKAALRLLALPFALVLTLAACDGGGGGGGGGGGDPGPQVDPVPGYTSVLVVDAKTAMSINGYPSAPNILLVRFKAGVTPQDMATTIAAAGGKVVGQIPMTMLVQAQFDGEWTEARANTLIGQLTAVTAVAGVTLDKFNVANAPPHDPWRSASSPPADPLDRPWDGSFSTGRNWRIKAMRAEAAWERILNSGRQLSQVVMGVIDYGFREGHEDLPNLKALNVQAPDLISGHHGMHVAGIMAAVGNTVGIAGVAQTGDHKIFAYDITNNGQRGIIEAGIATLLASTSGTVKVINLSFGEGYQDPLKDAVLLPPPYAWLPEGVNARTALKRNLRQGALQLFKPIADKDVLIVQAAGNTGIDAAYSGYAASALWDDPDDPDDARELARVRENLNITTEDLRKIRSKLLVVGATYPKGPEVLAKTTYSNTGKVIEVWAPGGETEANCLPLSYCLILSTGFRWDYVDLDEEKRPYIGTSMAAPHIAGLAGLLWQVNPGFSAAQIKNLILLRQPNGAERTSNVGHAPIDNGVVANADFSVDEALRFNNRAPIALFVASQSGSENVFSGASSIDPDGDPIASFAWTLRRSDGFLVASGTEANFRVTQRPGAHTISLQVTDSVGMISERIEQTVSLSGAPLPVVGVPSVSGVSPATMVADGVAKTLTIGGSGFTTGNVVQFRWGVGPGAGVWTRSAGAFSSLTSSRIVIPLNPGKVADTINVRVCRSASLTTDSDCSAGAIQSITVTPVLAVGPDLAIRNITVNSTNVAPGGQVALQFSVANEGTGTAAASTAIVRINQSSVSDAGPDLVTISVPSMAAGAFIGMSATVSAPATPGTYMVWVVAGDGGTGGPIKAVLAAAAITVLGSPPPPPPPTPPVVTAVSVNPASPVVGTQASFNVNGTNLQAGFTLSFPGCAATEVSSPSTTQRQFVCTLTLAGVNLAGSIRAASGAVLRSFTLSIAVSPAAPSQTATITQVLDNVGASTGLLARGATTDDTTPTLSGTLSAALTATQTLRVFNGSTILGAATVSGTTWSFTPTALASGNYSFTAAVVSVDGIEGNRSAAWGLIISAASSTALAQKVATGKFHSCALTSAGGVKCWGSNSNSTLSAGQLGDGTSLNRLVPVDVVGLSSGVVAVSAGAFHTCALTTAGGVKCWGQNFGALGDGTELHRLTPVDVVGLGSGVAAISAGGGHTCALTSTGGVKCWGVIGGLGLGDGTTQDRLAPVDVVGLTGGAVAIAAGNTHTCALTGAGGVKCWGGNLGRLGDGTDQNRLAPVDVVGLGSGVVAIAAGGSQTCAVTNAGGAKCWGNNVSGALGDGTTVNRRTPVDVAGLTSGVVALSAGDNHTCAVTTSGGVKCWGSDLSGQLGDGAFNVDRLTPVDVTGLSSGVTAVSAGGQHTCARTSAGSVKCWGFNGLGGLGDGTTNSRAVPLDVVGFQPAGNNPFMGNYAGSYAGGQSGTWAATISVDGTISATATGGFVGTGSVNSAGTATIALDGTGASQGFTITFSGTFALQSNGTMAGSGTWTSSSGLTGTWAGARIN